LFASIALREIFAGLPACCRSRCKLTFGCALRTFRKRAASGCRIFGSGLVAGVVALIPPIIAVSSLRINGIARALISREIVGQPLRLPRQAECLPYKLGHHHGILGIGAKDEERIKWKMGSEKAIFLAIVEIFARLRFLTENAG
jgi:hypothetical protein